VLNARLRGRWRQGGLTVARIGQPSDLTFPVQELGAGTQTLQELVDGGIGFAETLANATHPLVIVGAGTVARDDGAAVLALASRLSLQREGWNGFNVLHTAASRVGGLELCLVPAAGGLDVAGMIEAAERSELDALFLLGADEIDTSRLGSTFVVYQGHHGDRGAAAADVVLAGAAYTEKHGTYVNFEGRPQRAKLAVFPPGEAKEDWKILRALMAALGIESRINTLGDARARIAEVAPHLAEIDVVTPAVWSELAGGGELDRSSFASPAVDFYQTNPISRASDVMAECSRVHAERTTAAATGTHG
jgi:NADH-quinone oxidoreductase subunit G